ncbi:MAG TPA: hypothetical protein DEV81_11785 [Cyanobacteria bacterium UBA11049]|nr:hypothetical protein [Cyanobacteria bacterium UBA11049]
MLATELVVSTEGKTGCFEWHTDGWSGYERMLADEVEYYISKALTQRLERINSILRNSDRTVASATKRSLASCGSRQN